MAAARKIKPEAEVVTVRMSMDDWSTLRYLLGIVGGARAELFFLSLALANRLDEGRAPLAFAGNPL